MLPAQLNFMCLEDYTLHLLGNTLITSNSLIRVALARRRRLVLVISLYIFHIF